MLARKDHITDYIPQRHPMVMIDDLIEASDTHAISQLHIHSTNIFVEDNQLAGPGLVENMAQTAAAQVGYQCARKKVPVPIGYIAAVKNLEVFHLPALNSVITTSVRITNQVLDVTIAEGKVEQNGVLCCSCEMRIFIKT